MSQLVKSEFVSVLSALETVAGTLAATAWRPHQPQPGGISAFYAQIKTAEANYLNANLQRDKGDIVGLASAPSITQDATKAILDDFGEGIYRSATKFKGGTGVGRWMVANGAGGVSPPTIALTAVTATGYTVASGGAVLQNVLVNAQGFTNAANNGLKVVGAGSIGTEVKTAGLVVEAAPPAGARLEVVGYQGAANDIGVSAAQHLTSTANVLASLGLLAGDWIWLGGGTAAAPGLLGFTVSPQNRGYAKIVSVAAGILTLERRTQAWATDAGSGGKTIQFFFGPYLRNVGGLDPDYKEPPYSLELGLPGAGAAAATSYVYATGSHVNKFKFNAPSEGLAEVTLEFVGRNCLDPTTVRATNANLASPLINVLRMNTVNEERRLRVVGTDELGILSAISTWSLTISNNAKAIPQQGVLGASYIVFGDFWADLDLNVIFIEDDVCKAVRDYRTCRFEAAFRNGDGGWLFDVPSFTLKGANPTFAANEAVMLASQGEGFRDTTYNVSCSMTLFPYLPVD